VLLPSDTRTYRKHITSITAVLFPFVTYLLTFSLIYNFTEGAAEISARMYEKLTTEHDVLREVVDFSNGCALSS
jgi:hypothetical protein